MIDHVSIAVSDIERSARFYSAVLAPLGFTQLATREAMVGFGARYPEFWLNLRVGFSAPENPGVHIAFRAKNPEAVAECHAAALASGGGDAGSPGPRQAAMTTYVGGFVFDPDGNKVEFVNFPSRD